MIADESAACGAPSSVVEVPAKEAAHGSDAREGTPRFRLFVSAAFASSLGDALNATILPLLVLQLTGSGTQMGLVGLLQTAPGLVVLPIAGPLVDRFDRRRTMILLDGVRAMLVGAIPLCHLLGGPTFLVVLAVSAPLHACASLFLAAYQAAIPELVGRTRIRTGQSKLQAAIAGGYVAGPALAGLLSSRIHPALVLLVDALSFFVSAIAIASMPGMGPRTRPSGPPRLGPEVREGLLFIRRDPLLRTIVPFFAALRVISAGLIAVGTFLFVHDLKLSPATLGAFFSAYGVGSVAGALLASRVGARWGARAMLASNALAGAFLVAAAYVPSTPARGALLCAIGAANMMTYVNFHALRALASPDHIAGRIASLCNAAAIGLQPAGMVIAGIALDRVGGAPALAAMGAGLVLCSALFLRSVGGAPGFTGPEEGLA